MLNYANEMTDEDLRRTFCDTFLMHEGRVVLVSHIEDGTAILRNSFGNNKEVSVHELDFTMPDIGMTRIKDKTYYVARQPQRQWRRGFRPNYCAYYLLGSDGSVEKVSTGRIATNPFTLAKFILENPAHDTVLNTNFARRGKWLFFRSLPIGKVNKDKQVESDCPDYMKPELPEGYSYV